MSRGRRIREAAERITGVAFRPLPEVHRLQEAEVELRGAQRQLQDLGYELMGYSEGTPQDMKAEERVKLAQQARVIWSVDPQFGGQVNLLNEFVLGRGIGKPAAVDEDVQRFLDRFWDDPDNRRVLTTHEAQVRFNTDLSLQANVFPLVYDDGEDAAVKLGLLDHDTVTQAVRDDDARLRVLYYFTKARKRKWNVQKHAYEVSREANQIRYYEEFRNLQDAKRDQEAGVRKEALPNIPDALVGRGRVLHVAINRTMEQAFGTPEIARTIRWLTAYNDLMRARVDMAKAAASIIMRRKLKGGAGAMQQLAQQALLAAGASATAPPDPAAMAQAPTPASVLEENEYVDHEPFNLKTGDASQDMRGIRAQLSVGSGWPDPYIGGDGGNLSQATQLELRVLKMVEARQQVLEDLIRALCQHVIRKALEKRLLSRFRPMTEEEREREAQKMQEEQDAAATPAVGVAEARLSLVEPEPEPRVLRWDEYADVSDPNEEPPAGYVERDLDFNVSMPSPLRRAMGDLITAVANIAKTFDPNNTNQELSKLLLGIALGEGLEVEDPGAAVERIFPEGYVDPAVAAALAQSAQQVPEEMPGSVGIDGQRHPNPDNPAGVPQEAQPPELVMQQAAVRKGADALGDRRLIQLHSRLRDRQGVPMPLPVQVQEAIVQRAAARIVAGAPSQQGQLGIQGTSAVRQAKSDIEADSVLGPALSEALALVN